MAQPDSFEVSDNELETSESMIPTHSLAFTIFPRLIDYDSIPSLSTELDFQTKIFYTLVIWLIFTLISIFFAWLKFGAYLNTIHSDGKFKLY